MNNKNQIKALFALTLGGFLMDASAYDSYTSRVFNPSTGIETVRYTNGQTITYKYANVTTVWSANHLTSTTTYTFLDRLAPYVVISSGSPYTTKTYSGNIETITTNYPDGYKSSTFVYALNIIPQVTYSLDHKTQYSTYNFSDGTKNVVSAPAIPTVISRTYGFKGGATPVETQTIRYPDGFVVVGGSYVYATSFKHTYGADHKTVNKTWYFSDGTTWNESSKTVQPVTIVLALPTGNTINTSKSTTQTKYVDGYATTKEVLQLRGTSVSANYTASSIGSVSSIAQGAQYQETIDSAPYTRNLKTITYTSAAGQATAFSGYDGTTFQNALNNRVQATLDNSNKIQALTVLPDAQGWSYQSFGAWNNAATSTISAGSAGSLVTEGRNIPVTGSATFNGVAGGIYRDSSNTNFIVAADMQANANFANRSVSFSTTNSQMTSNLNNVTSAPGLNLIGTLNYAAGVNSFNGSVSSANGMNGSAGGQFYGPTANEIGGVFAVRNGNTGYIGGFGGKR